MKLELSPRLAAVAGLIPQGARLADVGTDHAYLPVSLLLEGKLNSAIAADVRTGPLEHARRTARAYAVSDRLLFRLCDGLASIAPDECDTISIAGMGGETIAGILAQAPWSKEKTLILQPQSTQSVLRRFLAENGYAICAEQVVREGGRWYPVLLVKSGEMPPLNPGEALAGRAESWSPQPERRAYLMWLLRQVEAKQLGLSRATRAEDALRLGELEAQADFLHRRLSELPPDSA